MRFNTPISGTGQLTLLGGGLVILSTSNAFSGTLVTSTDPGATFTLSNVNALRSAELTMVMPNSNGFFGAGFGTFSLGGLSGSTSITGFGSRSLDIGGNGSAQNFNADGNYCWRIATAAGGVTGFAANKFQVNTSGTNGTAGFANSIGSGQFSVANNGNDVSVVFTPAIVLDVTSGTQTQQGTAATSEASPAPPRASPTTK